MRNTIYNRALAELKRDCKNISYNCIGLLFVAFLVCSFSEGHIHTIRNRIVIAVGTSLFLSFIVFSVFIVMATIKYLLACCKTEKERCQD